MIINDKSVSSTLRRVQFAVSLLPAALYAYVTIAWARAIFDPSYSWIEISNLVVTVLVAGVTTGLTIYFGVQLLRDHRCINLSWPRFALIHIRIFSGFVMLCLAGIGPFNFLDDITRQTRQQTWPGFIAFSFLVNLALTYGFAIVGAAQWKGLTTAMDGSWTDPTTESSLDSQ